MFAAVAALTIVSTGCAHTRSGPSRSSPRITGAQEVEPARIRSAQPPPLPPTTRAITLRDRISLFWEYPEEGDDTLSFNLWHSPTLPTLLSGGWAFRTNIPGTDRKIILPLEPGVHFFTLSASNFWGESSFSNVASTPAPPRSDFGMSIKPGTED